MYVCIMKQRNILDLWEVPLSLPDSPSPPQSLVTSIPNAA